jgi:hypothetical protein
MKGNRCRPSECSVSPLAGTMSATAATDVLSAVPVRSVTCEVRYMFLSVPNDNYKNILRISVVEVKGDVGVLYF